MTAPRPGLVVTGSIALDTLEGEFGRVDEELGGSALYFAVAARLAAPDLPVALVAPVGIAEAQRVRDLARNYELDAAGLAVIDAPTFRWSARGFGGRNVDLGTQDSIYDRWSPSIPEGSAWGFVGSVRPDHQVAAARALAGRAVVAGDAMLSYVTRRPREAAELPALCNWFFANEEELAALGGSGTDPDGFRARHRLAGVVLKRGAAGVVCATPAARIAVGAAAGPVVDTTGAGDSVAGAMLARWALAGGDADALPDAVRWGVAAASLTIAGIGLRAALRATPRELAARVSELGGG